MEAFKEDFWFFVHFILNLPFLAEKKLEGSIVISELQLKQDILWTKLFYLPMLLRGYPESIDYVASKPQRIALQNSNNSPLQGWNNFQ